MRSVASSTMKLGWILLGSCGDVFSSRLLLLVVNWLALSRG